MMALMHNAATLKSEAVHQPTGNTALGLSSTSPEGPLVTILKLETMQHLSIMKSQIMMPMMIKITIFRELIPRILVDRYEQLGGMMLIFYAEDGGSLFLQNVEAKHTAV
jgi:hypothetical protein